MIYKLQRQTVAICTNILYRALHFKFEKGTANDWHRFLGAKGKFVNAPIVFVFELV